MASLKIIIDAQVSKALAALEQLKNKNDETKKKMSEPAKTGADRRGALEEYRTKKIEAEAAKREKAETQAAIRVQAAAVKEAEAAVKAAGDKTAAQKIATAELERQRKELERLKQIGKIKSESAEVAAVGTHRARQTVQSIPAPAVPKSGVSVWGKIFSSGKAAAAGLETRFEKMKSRVGSIFSGVSGIVTGALAFAGIGVGMSAIKQTINDLDNLGKSARNMGMSAEELQKFQYAAQSVNFPVEQIQPSMDKMRKIVGDAFKGIPDAQKKLATLGVSMDDLKGKGTAEMFETISDAITSIADPTMQAAEAVNIFGEQGPKMLNFMKDYKAAASDLEGRGAIISDEQVAAAEAFNQACTNIATSLRAWAVNSGFIEQLKNAAEYLDIIAKHGSIDNFAKSKGVYTRSTGVDYAVNKAAESKKYTPEEIKEMLKWSHAYKKGDYYSDSKGYALIDRAMNDAGLGDLARNEKGTWDGKSESSTIKETPEERKKKAEAANAEKKKRDDAKAAREQRRKEALEKDKREKEARVNASIDEQINELEVKSGGKPKSREERRRAAIEAETNKAEKTAKAAGVELSAEKRTRVENAAGEVFDAEEKKAEDNGNNKIDDQITALKERYKQQQLILQGKAREAAIQNEISLAEKTAAASGVELTAEKRAKIAEVAGANFDLSNRNRDKGGESKAEVSQIVGAENKVFTDNLLRMGGMLGSVGNGAKTDYTQKTSQTLDKLEAKIGALYDKIPNRTEQTEITF